MLAHNQGQMLNAARLAAGLGVSGQTVVRYLDTLVDLLLVRRLQPWTANLGKRLVRSPKVFVRDSGVLHALLGLTDQEQVLGHPVAGSSWEGFVIENLLAAAPAAATAWFYRTANGAEVDLLLDLGPQRLWAVEVKRSLNPQPAKGFHLACNDVKATHRFVVYPGKERYRLDPSTEAVPLAALLHEAGQ
jgi:predicted AAA+ superfamily ATPase